MTQSTAAWTRVGSLDAVTIDCADPLKLERFWGAVFGIRQDSTLGDDSRHVDLLTLIDERPRLRSRCGI